MDSTNTLPQIEVAQSQKEVTANELFAAASGSMFAARNADECDGLVWAYLGGRYASSLVANGSTTLGASTTTYMVADLATGAISFATTTTNWDDSENYGRCYLIVTGASAVTSWEDHRGPGPLGIYRTADPSILGAGLQLRGLRFTADAAATTDADPGAGKLRWNNADQSLATQLYIDNASLDGVSINGFWGSLPSAGYLYLQQADDADIWQLWEWTATPTDGTGYYKFTVTLRGKSTAAIGDTKGIYTAISCKPGSAGSTQGKHAIYIAAKSMAPRSTSGCASLAVSAGAANQPDFCTLDFDASSQEYAEFELVMPKKWNEGTVTFVPHWSHASTTTNFGVAWSLQAVAVGNDDALAATFGTAQTSVDTGGTTGDLYAGPESSAITVAGSPGPEEMVFFRLSRLVSDGGDTMAIDARLHGVTVYVTTNADTDA
jgi:hypothetical protein